MIELTKGERTSIGFDLQSDGSCWGCCGVGVVVVVADFAVRLCGICS